MTTLALLLCAPVLRAQVTFSGTQFALASGTWNAPASAAMDGASNLYIADTGNDRIVELPAVANGFGSPVVLLNGLSSPGGIASDWYGNLFVSDTGNGRVLMIPVSKQGYGAPVTLASGLSAPEGIAVDGTENLYVAVSGSNSILEIPYAAGAYSAAIVVGTGYNKPMGVAVDSSRNLFIADTGNNRVVKEAYSAAGYTTQQVMWKTLLAPAGVAVDRNHNVYIADTGNQRVIEQMWSSGSGLYYSTPVIGTGTASPAAMAIPVTASGQVFLADTGNNRVLEVENTGVNFSAVAVGAQADELTYNFSVTAGTALGSVSINTQGVGGKDFTDGGSSSCVAQTYAATTLCGVNVNFSPLLPGLRMGAVVLSDPTGKSLATAFLSGVGQLPKAGFIPGVSTALGSNLSGPSGVAVDGNGNVYIADTGNNRVVELPWTGNGYGPQTVIPITGLNTPMGLAIDGAGNLFIASNGNDKVVMLPWTPNGFGPQARAGSGLYGPSNVAVDASGTVYIADTLDDRVDKITWTGSAYTQENNIGNYHKLPTGLAVDANGNVYYTTPYQNDVIEFPWVGTHYTDQFNLPAAGTAFPIALATDANCDIYILDSVNGNVVMLPWNGTAYGAQITVASGFNAPTAMTLDGNGILYVADTGNNQIVRIDMSSPGGMSYQSTYLGSTSQDSAQITLVGNLGNLPLALDSVRYPVDFPQGAANAQACSESTTLPASEWCNLAVNFTPQTASSMLSEAVAVTSNSLGIPGTQHTVPVSGSSLSRASQSVAFSAPSALIYGAAPIPLTATASSGLPVSFTVLSGPATIRGNGQLLSVTGAGQVVVQASQSGNGAYAAASPVTVSFNVAPAMLTVTVSNIAAVYGAIPSSFHYAIAGLVNGDNSWSVVSGQPSIVSGAKPSSGVGAYPIAISLGTLQAANYVFQFVPGTLTVAPAVLHVAVKSTSHAYGTALPALGCIFSGFVNGDGPGVVSGAPQLSTTANSGSPVGAYPITASLGTLTAANYTFSLTGATLTVNPGVLTVTANSPSITYGESMPALAYTISGFMNGDSAANAVQGAASLSTQAAHGAGVGTYPVVPAVGTLKSANYSFQFVSGRLSVLRATLTVTVINASMTYGSQMPTLAYTIAGFVNGETAASAISGQPAISTAATSRSIPGPYPIAASLGSLTARNYAFAFAAGVLSIQKAMLTVAPKPTSIVYGQKLPGLTCAYTGFVDGDGISSVSGAPSFTSKAAAIPAAGTYPLVLALGTLASQKYTFTLQNGTLTVTPAVLTVQAQSTVTTYGQKLPAITYSMRGFVNGDTQAAIAGAPQVTLSAGAKPNAGVYAIAIAAGTLKAGNYTFNLLPGQFTVNPASLTLTAASTSIKAGSAIPALTFTAAGLVNGETLAKAATGAPSLTTTATASSKAGKYPIVLAKGTLAAANYTVTLDNGTLTITQ